mgnify:CR=1 FL=1
MLKEEISAYEDLCDFFYEVSPLMYCTPMTVDIYGEFIRYLALVVSSLMQCVITQKIALASMKLQLTSMSIQNLVLS